ncbi:MAG: ribosomal-processing cysteine protease Prp [Erysipelotrichaceae bacterium]|nr:ribosomal-processing cysteine protease Prp [Erysipelotrichaceae bacterium]
MIAVLYDIDDDVSYTYLSIKGHAEFADYGKDLICASVSSIAFGLMNALDEIEGVTIKESENQIEIINESSSPKANDFMELALIQLKTIEESYSGFIKVERK